MNNINYRYFFYSPTAAEKIKKIENSISSGFQLPWVIVRGVRKYYTEIVTSPEKVRFKDSIKIAEGDMRRMEFSQLDR